MKRILSFLTILFSLQVVLAQDDIEVVNIENEAVQAYMQDSCYFLCENYDTSVVMLYADKELYGPKLDWPAGKELRWKRKAAVDEIEEIRITVGNRPDYRYAATHTTSSASAESYVIRNLFPRKTYYYKVEEVLSGSQANLLQEGVFRTIGQVRMISVEGASNVRDIGGWPTSFGCPIRYGLLYRSGNLDGVTERGIHDFVDNLGVGAELDLRGLERGERGKSLAASPLGEDVSYIQIPNDSYALSSQSDNYVRDLRWILQQLRDGQSVDWHCAVGCDRCGTLSFLIEGLLGVSEADLCRDYELSCFRGHKRYRSHQGFGKMMRYIKRIGPDDDLAQCFYNYWKASGMTDEELIELREILLEDFTP